jgi:uncharacterized membrane protein (DUF4010 family)
MPEYELMQRAALAIAIGLLIGIQRGWQDRQLPDGGRVAGVRTFTLIGMLGGISGLLSLHASQVLAAASLLGFALPFGFFEWNKARQSKNLSATNFIAGLLTFALSTYAAVGDMAIAAAGGVIAAAVLSHRKAMHSFLIKLRWNELRAGLVLLVMSAILLPVLPDRAIDPWGALNPYKIWLMTVLVGVISYGGYMSIRFAGARRGLLYAALMGGIVSSTTVTWTFARLARRDTVLQPQVMSSILSAWIVSLMRMTAIAVVVAPSLLLPLGIPMAAAALSLLIPALVSFHIAGSRHTRALNLDDPLELTMLIRFTALFAAILLFSKIAAEAQSSVLLLGAASGLLDVDPITLSMAQLAGRDISISLAVSTILLAAAANGLAKTVLATSFGGLRLGIPLSASAILAAVAGATAHLLIL